jgi:hypothetical protein
MPDFDVCVVGGIHLDLILSGLPKERAHAYSVCAFYLRSKACSSQECESLWEGLWKRQESRSRSTLLYWESVKPSAS